MKICTRCRVALAPNLDNFHSTPSTSDHLSTICKPCTNTRARRKNAVMRLEVLARYTPDGVICCACCGEDHEAFMSLDHIGGGGGKHREAVGRSGLMYLYWLKINGYPEGYRVLCFNCNQSIGHRGFCPHDNERAQPAA